MGVKTLANLFGNSVTRFSHVLALNAPHRTPPLAMTYGELGDKVTALSGGFLALGVMRGDRVALISDNRPEWLMTDLALVTMGAVCVPRGADTSTAEIWYIINHSEAKVVVLENRNLFARIASELSSAPSIGAIVLLDNSAAALQPQTTIRLHNFEELFSLGRSQAEDVKKLRAEVSHDDIAAIVYTSGTTGIPKGVPLRHSNLVYQCEAIDLGFQIKPGDVLLSILPSWHVYERIGEYYGFSNGATIFYTDKRWLRDDMANAHPAFIPCVPRIWESVYDAIMAKIAKEPPPKARIVEKLIQLSRQYVRHRRLVRFLEASPKPASLGQRAISLAKCLMYYLPHKIADLIVYRKLRALTGTRLKAAVSGGGTLAPYLDDFFEAVGIPILNGYGLTETSPVLAVRTTKQNIRGTVGPPLRGTQIEIRDENGKVLPQGQTGIVWARGPQVMSGYYRNEEETKKVLTPDGWFNTGDLGWFTWQGHLVISGRAKDTIVLLSGENVEPERIEAVARKNPLIAQIVVVGQDKKALGALVVPNFPELASCLGLSPETSAHEIVRHPDASRLVREAINDTLAEDGSFRAFEFIQRVRLLDEPFTPENGLLTQTLKPKRNVIMSRFAKLIEEMYE